METKELNGFWFNEETDTKVMSVISGLTRETRIRVWYGDNKTGKSWDEENDICGYIGRTTGTNKIPILVNNSRSYGGGALSCRSIVKIMETKTKRVLYQHPNFNQSVFTVIDKEVFADGEIYGRCKSEKSAQRLADFMNGKRMSK